MQKVVTVIAITMSLYHLLYISDVFTRLGIYILPPIHRMISLTFVLVLTPLLVPARRGQRRRGLTWFDVLLLASPLVAGIYYIAFFDQVTEHWTFGRGTALEVAFFFITFIAVFEGGRRIAGLALPMVMAFFFLYTLYGNYFPGPLHSKGFPIERVVGYVYLSGEGLLGMPLGVAATMVIMFVIFGRFLEESGAGSWFINLAFSLVGRVRGGPAKAVIIADIPLGTMTGSTTASVVATGVITIPLMKRTGYSPEVAGAIEAVSSNGSQIMPPVMGAVAFILAEWIGVPYYQVALAALLPALIYYAVLFLMVDLEAGRKGMKGLPPEELPSLWKTFKEGWHYLIPMVGLVVILMALKYQPEKSALYSLMILFLVSFLQKKSRMGLGKILTALKESAKTMPIVTISCAAAGFITGFLTLTGLGINLSKILLDIAGGNLFILLLLTALTSFVMGMGMTSVPVYIMLALLIAPALVEMGIPPIAAHLFVFYWALASFITPPVAVAAYAASAIAKSNVFQTGVQATRLGICTFILPFIWIYHPGLLLLGSPVEVVEAAIIAVVASFAIATGVAGYAFTRMSWIERILFFAGAIALIFPGLTSDLIGAAFMAAGLLLQWRSYRTTQAARKLSLVNDPES